MRSADLWRGVYWSEQVSLRTRVLLMLDWVKRGIFGRDLSRVSSFVLIDGCELIKCLPL